MTASSLASYVSRWDKDRYTTALFAPPSCQESLMALYAFNIDIAAIVERASEPLVIQMRFQWWRESLEALFQGRAPRHFVLDGLRAAVQKGKMTRAPMERLLEARARAVATTTWEQPAFFTHLEETSVPLIVLACQALGGEEGESVKAARAVGLAWALVGTLRAVPFYAAQQRCLLPGTLCQEAGFDPADLYHGPYDDPEASGRVTEPRGLAHVVERLARQAESLLAQARCFPVSRPLRPAFLVGSLAEMYLKMLKQAKYNPFKLKTPCSHTGRVLRLWWKSLRGF